MECFSVHFKQFVTPLKKIGRGHDYGTKNILDLHLFALKNKQKSA